MTIHEPSTLLTDFLLAGLGGFLTRRLWKARSPLFPAGKWWLYSMALLALSAFIGGSYHGFSPNFSPLVDQVWWRLVLSIISLLGFTIGAALVAELAPAKMRGFLQKLLLIKLLAFLGVIFIIPVFLIVIIDYGSAMLAWFLAALLTKRPWRRPAILAVSLSGLAAMIQQQRHLTLGVLNQNDLFHLVQALALMAFAQVAHHCRSSQTPRQKSNHHSGPALTPPTPARLPKSDFS